MADRLRLDPDNPRAYVDADGMRVVNANTVTALRERDEAWAECRAAREELDVNDKAWRAERDTLLAQLEKTCATLMREERAHADTMAARDDLDEMADRLAGVVAHMLSLFRGDGPNSRHSGWVRDETLAAWRSVLREWADRVAPEGAIAPAEDVQDGRTDQGEGERVEAPRVG